MIDLGPEAGIDGGQIVVAQGTPEDDRRIRVCGQQSKIQVTHEELDRRSTGSRVESKGPTRNERLTTIRLDRWKKGDMDIEDVGKSVKMPWQADGRRWHTQDRVGRNGEAVNWDGKILETVVDKIQEHEGFSETKLERERSVVEISGSSKIQMAGFCTRLTGESWLLKMKFRVRPRTFKKDELVDQIPLATANELDDLPIYGNQPRVRITSNPWRLAGNRNSCSQLA